MVDDVINYAGSAEDSCNYSDDECLSSSFVKVNENISFSEVLKILNDGISKGKCEEFDSIVKSDNGHYDKMFVSDLNDKNFKAFCLEQLKIKVNEGYLYNELLEYKSESGSGNHNYSVRELIFLVIAADDNLSYRYKNELFADNDLSPIKERGRFLILIIGVCNKAYINALLEKLQSSSKLNSSFYYDDVFSLLEAASVTKNVECEKKLIELLKTARPNVSQGISSNPLSFAIKYRSLNTVLLLLRYGFNSEVNALDSDGNAPLHIAMGHLTKITTDDERMKLLDTLLKSGVDINIRGKRGNTPLHNAAYLLSYDTVLFLIERGANFKIKNDDGKLPLDLAESKFSHDRTSKEKIVNYLRELDKSHSLLHYWSNKSDLYHALEYNLKQGVESINDKDSSDWTPIGLAIRDGCIKNVELLLKYDANVNLITRNGYTHLYWAMQRAASCRCNKSQALKIVNLVLEKVQSIDKESFKEAIDLGNFEIVKICVKKGADLDEKIMQKVIKSAQSNEVSNSNNDRNLIANFLIECYNKDTNMENNKLSSEEGKMLNGVHKNVTHRSKESDLNQQNLKEELEKKNQRLHKLQEEHDQETDNKKKAKVAGNISSLKNQIKNLKKKVNGLQGTAKSSLSDSTSTINRDYASESPNSSSGRGSSSTSLSSKSNSNNNLSTKSEDGEMSKKKNQNKYQGQGKGKNLHNSPLPKKHPNIDETNYTASPDALSNKDKRKARQQNTSCDTSLKFNGTDDDASKANSSSGSSIPPRLDNNSTSNDETYVVINSVKSSNNKLQYSEAVNGDMILQSDDGNESHLYGEFSNKNSFDTGVTSSASSYHTATSTNGYDESEICETLRSLSISEETDATVIDGSSKINTTTVTQETPGQDNKDYTADESSAIPYIISETPNNPNSATPEQSSASCTTDNGTNPSQETIVDVNCTADNATVPNNPNNTNGSDGEVIAIKKGKSSVSKGIAIAAGIASIPAFAIAALAYYSIIPATFVPAIFTPVALPVIGTVPAIIPVAAAIGVASLIIAVVATIVHYCSKPSSEVEKTEVQNQFSAQRQTA
ncbi:ankyrin repeat domain-containing protein [Wolbachia endosymbiont of Pentidionis agamae]|uniref:ankyrin repeat domain-containing protein n=1 Tax=Wolbachia endosymbiont of Pentidionis agamae TaxID=3110435 RepID=UPI002FD18B76